MMEKMMTEETPTKVLSLLAVALTSMFMLFFVASNDASWQGATHPVAGPFNPDRVMAALDNASASYSQFLAQNLTEPAKADYEMYADTGRWIMDNSDMAILNAVGLQDLAKVPEPQPRVAGAFIDTTQPQTLYPVSQRPMSLLDLLGF